MNNAGDPSVQVTAGTPERLRSAGIGAVLVLRTPAPMSMVGPVIDRVVDWAHERQVEHGSWPGCYGGACLPGQSVIHLECDEAALEQIAQVCAHLQQEAAAAGISGVIEAAAAPEVWEPLPMRAVSVEALITEEISLPRRARYSYEPRWVNTPSWIEASAGWLEGASGPAGCCFDGWFANLSSEQVSGVVRQNLQSDLEASYWVGTDDIGLRTMRIPEPSSGPLQVGIGFPQTPATDLVDRAVSALVTLVEGLDPQPGYAAVAVGERWPIASLKAPSYRSGSPVPRPGGTVLDPHHWQWLSREMTDHLDPSGPGERQVVICGTPREWLDRPDAARAAAYAVLGPIVFIDTYT